MGTIRETAINSSVSRRSFLRNAGLAAGAIAAASSFSLTGCAETKGSKRDNAEWDYETDVVIVGFGGAGACSAIAAADSGANVILLEKNLAEEHLSNTIMCGGFFHSPDKSGDPEALKQYLRAMFSGDNLESKVEGDQSPLFVDEIVEKFAQYEPDNYDFLMSLDPDLKPLEAGGASFPSFPGAEKSGYKGFRASYSGKSESPKFPTIDLPKEDTASGLALFNCMKTGVEDRADKISVMYGTPGKKLIVGENNEIQGIVATLGEAEIKIKAKRGVILTSGGFEYNEEMRRAFLEGPGINGWAFYGTLSNEGDGIRMGCEVGAQLAKVGKAASRLIWACPDITHNNCMVGSITDSAGTAGTIVVNAQGKRFMDENLITVDPSRYFSYKNAIHMDIETLEFPNDPSYMIIDETKRLQGSLLNLSTSTCGFGIIPWDEKNQTAVDKGWLIKGNTIEELAQKIRDSHDLNKSRMDPAVLTETMQAYQKIVDTGVDEEFGRTSARSTMGGGSVEDAGFQAIATPPFYALPLYAGGPNTKGGLQTDGNRQVVDWFNQPISRLYSAGEMSSVFKFVYQGGGNISECIVCGRIAGENAAAETPWDKK